MEKKEKKKKALEGYDKGMAPIHTKVSRKQSNNSMVEV